MPKTKMCRGCGAVLPLSGFQKRKACSDGRDTRCRTCRSEEQKAKHDRMFEHEPERITPALRMRVRAKPTWYEKQLKKQGGRCAICKQPPPPGRRFARDHCHQSGHLRGVLCSACNSMLGFAKDDPEILAEGAKYLVKAAKAQRKLAKSV